MWPLWRREIKAICRMSKVDLVYLGWTTITWIKDRPVLQVPTGLMLPRPSLINLVRGTTVYRERSSVLSFKVNHPGHHHRGRHKLERTLSDHLDLRRSASSVVSCGSPADVHRQVHEKGGSDGWGFQERRFGSRYVRS
jgi:hypothetical protein